MHFQEGQSLCDRIVLLASSTRFSYLEAYIESSTSGFFAIEQGKMNASGFSESVGLRIRAIANGSLHIYSTNRPSYEDARQFLSKAKRFNGVRNALAPAEAVHARYSIKESVPLDGEYVMGGLVAADRELSKKKSVKFRNIYASYGRTDSYFANSEGSSIEASLPSINVFGSLIVGNGKETRQSSSSMQYGGTGGYELIEKENLSERLPAAADSLLKIIETGITLKKEEIAGIHNVVVSPDIIGIAVHESVGHPLEADRVFGREAAQAGTSYIDKENFGMQMGTGEVTIIDNPAIKSSNGFYLYDDEGVKASEKVLVRNGRQETLLTNREYASVLGNFSNGSARSESYATEPIVRMSNTYLENGKNSFDDLLGEARNGVYVKSFAEWNIDDTRSFSRYQGNEAYLIRGGSIGRPVKNFIIETTTLDFWKSVRMRAGDFGLSLGTCGKGEPMQGVPVTMGGPSTLLVFDDHNV